MREEEIKQLEIDKIHWRDLYWEECEKNKNLKEENRKLSEGKIIYASEKEQRHYVDILEENIKLKADSYNELQRLGLENYELREENRKLEKKIKELEKICEWYEIENNIETMQKPIDPKILE